MIARYHVHLGAKRTTVSLDPFVTELLALKLGCTPRSPAASRAVRQWLQQRLDDANDPGRYRVSRWLHAEVIYYLVDKELAVRHDDWLLDG